MTSKKSFMELRKTSTGAQRAGVLYILVQECNPAGMQRAATQRAATQRAASHSPQPLIARVHRFNNAPVLAARKRMFAV